MKVQGSGMTDLDNRPGRHHAAAEPLDLDRQIDLIEQRLIDREDWMRATALSLGERAQQAVKPRPWWLPVLGGVAVLWLGWRWAHRRSGGSTASAALPAVVANHRPSGLAAVPWGGLAALGWPLLPIAWRARVRG